MQPDSEVVVFRSAARDSAREHALVLLAMGIEYDVQESGGELRLAVRSTDAARASEQLRLYRRENTPGRAAPAPPSRTTGGMPGMWAYIAVLLGAAFLQTRGLFGLDWYGAGKLDAALVRAGEWWRTVTALTLHLDLPHLVGNLIFGALFGLGAGQALGSGAAWFSILVAGTAGNALNVLLQSPSHKAVGASTAVFGALGIVAAYLWRQRRDLGERWAYRWAPMVGGVVLLAFLGVGGERTDVVAHLTGFTSGALLGSLWGMLHERGSETLARGQRLLGTAAAIMLACAWLFALHANG